MLRNLGTQYLKELFNKVMVKDKMPNRESFVESTHIYRLRKYKKRELVMRDRYQEIRLILCREN